LICKLHTVRKVLPSPTLTKVSHNADSFEGSKNSPLHFWCDFSSESLEKRE